MAGAGSVDFPSATLVRLEGSVTSSLRPGQVFQTTVQARGDALSIQVGALRIPIPADGGLQPGQNVTAQVVQEGQVLQLQVSPQNVPAGDSGAPAALGTAVATALETLGMLHAADLAPRLLPRNLPTNGAAVRDLLALFAAWDSLAEDLDAVSSALARAAAAGVVPRELARAFAEALARLFASDPRDFDRVLRQAASRSGKSLAARIAAAAASGTLEDLLDELSADIRALAAQLREHEGLGRFLRNAGEETAFREAMSRIHARFSGQALQNLRSFEQPYLFLELPFGAGSPITHAQVHFFGEEKGGRRFDPANATVILDLATTQLGSLWISVKITQGHCSCWFRVDRPAAVKAIESATADLVDSLADAGYPGAKVRVEGWDGDRFAAAAGLMRRFRPFEASV